MLISTEDTYYRQGLANFTEEDFKKAGYAEKLHTDLTAISSNERKHVHFLSKALRGKLPIYFSKPEELH